MFSFRGGRNRREEFEAELNKCLSLLYNIALHLTRNREDAEDLIQETSIRALRYFDRYKTGTNFKAWAVTIMKNIFINNYRKKKREPQKVDFDKVSNFVSLPKITGLEEEILQEKLEYALNDLPKNFKQILTLYYLENFSYKEIAELVDIPIGTVMSRLYNARQMLKESLFVYDDKKE